MRSVGRFAGAAVVACVLLIVQPVAAQTDEEATATYLAAIADLESRAAVLVTEVEAVNASWDSREATFDATLQEMQRIETETGGIRSELGALTPPEDLEGQHEVMIQTADAMVAAAGDMIAGLQGADTGEARQAATIAYLGAATDFSDLALLARGGPGDTTTTTTTTLAPATTTTVSEPATTTTQAVVAATTSTTEAVAQPETEPDSDGSGAPWLLLPVVMVVGIVLGLVAGLLIGRKARFELIDTIRALRGGQEPPTPDDS